MEELSTRRHPAIVSTAGSFTTAASDYVPPPELDAGLIAGHPWGERTIRLGREQVQYMVYDRDARNVLSCCPTPELAARWAVDRLEREAIPPSDHSPRLAGFRYGQRASEKSCLLVHTVLDVDGREVAASTDGREKAAAQAVKAIVSRKDCVDATREEFAATLVFALTTKGIGRKSLPLVYDNSLGSQDQSAVRKELLEIWNATPHLRVDREDVPESVSSIDPMKFVDRSQSHLLRTAARMSGSVSAVNVTFGESERTARFVFHDGRLSVDQMIDHLYEDYLRDVAPMQDRSANPHRPAA